MAIWAARVGPSECPFHQWWRSPSTNGLLLPSQLLNQVLNRVTAERNLFDRVVTLRLPGEDLDALHPNTLQALVPLLGTVMPNSTFCPRTARLGALQPWLTLL